MRPGSLSGYVDSMTITPDRKRAPRIVPVIEHHLEAVHRHVSRGPLGPPDSYRLAELDHIGTQVYTMMCQEVQTLRKNGWTWQQIGDALDVSRQSAWERFHHVETSAVRATRGADG